MKKEDFQVGDIRHDVLETIENLSDPVTPEQGEKLSKLYKEICECAYAKIVTMMKEQNPFSYVALSFLGREMTLEDTSKELRSCVNFWDDAMDCMATILILRQMEMMGNIDPPFRIHDTEEEEENDRKIV